MKKMNRSCDNNRLTGGDSHSSHRHNTSNCYTTKMNRSLFSQQQALLLLLFVIPCCYIQLGQNSNPSFIYASAFTTSTCPAPSYVLIKQHQQRTSQGSGTLASDEASRKSTTGSCIPSVTPRCTTMTTGMYVRPRSPLLKRLSAGLSPLFVSSVLYDTSSNNDSSDNNNKMVKKVVNSDNSRKSGRFGLKRFRDDIKNEGNGGFSLGGGIGGSVPPLGRHPPRKVCLMIEPTPFTHVSGYANRFKEMLKFLKKAGDDVDILTVDTKTPAKELPNHFLGYPIRHTQGFTFPLYNHISLTMDLPELKGARIIERLKPDLIHVTSPGFLLFAALFYARVMKIPLVMSYHTHLPTYGRNYLNFIPRIEQACWDVIRYVHSRADLTLVTSPQMKEEMISNGVPRVDVWRKGIDTERFHPSYMSTSMRNTMSSGNPSDFLMVYIGRLGAEKRLKDLKPVLERIPNARLCIVGNGPQKEELQQYFANTNTVFTGQLQGDDLSAAFASADVFVMPSDSETLGFVVLESMASGIPVVGAAAGGILDLIHEGVDGYLVAPGDTDGYVAKLQLLATDSSLRTAMGIRARKEAEKWGWEAATSYLRNVQYEKALINFHSRAFGGFGRPGTAGLFRLFQYRFQSLIRRFDRRLTVWKSIGRNILSFFWPSSRKGRNNNRDSAVASVSTDSAAV